MSRTGGIYFGPDGCQVPIGKIICGETRTLDIINEFKRLYEEKMKEIDNNGGGDCLQEKIKLQQDWIGDLTDQNEMLVRAVEELEVEATDRVNMLEEKLQQSAKCICEVMKKYRETDITNKLLKEPQERIFHLENDLKNILEFIRRIRVENEWNMGGLTFFDITFQDLFGDENGEDSWKEKCDRYLICDNTKEEKKVRERECTIQNLHSKLADVNTLSQELNEKKQECDALKKNLIDVRQALTEEVASKHDTILKLKRDYQELEDRCVQADKQTAFRDDIIKELRKEVKQLKQQENDELRRSEIGLLEKTKDLENKLELLKYSLSAIDSPLKKNITKLSESFHEKNLYSFMENEIIQLNSVIEINRFQLKEQLELIKIMARKLFKIDIGLEIIEERVISVNYNNLDKTKIELQAKNLYLVQTKSALEANVKEYKTQIQDLEEQFKEFLKDKTQLKEKYTTVKNQCKCVLEESVKLKSENDVLKKNAEDLKIKYENHVQSKVILEEDMNKLKEDLNSFLNSKDNCICQFEKMKQENKKLMDDLCDLNNENRNLLKSVDNQKKQIGLLTTVTCEEIGKLNGTIEELHCTLEKTKKVQEEEYKDKNNTINILNNKIIKLENSVREAEEKAKICKICKGRSRVAFANSSEVQTEETETYSDAIALIQERDQMILSQRETLHMFEKELQSLKHIESELKKETKKYREETEYLKDRINDMENTENSYDNSGEYRLETLMEALQNRDTIIKNQNQSLMLIQQELEFTKKQLLEITLEREKCYGSINVLKNKIEELEAALKNAEGRADNLQTAVNLYMNSINVLEASEEKYKIEIDQQRMTITNLRSALVDTKQELDYLKQKSDENLMEQQQSISEYISIVTATEVKNNDLQILCGDLLDEYKQLQDLNLNVEIEYCNNLQDTDELESRLLQYQHEIKFTEQENRQWKSNAKKLMKQKKCYEEIILYFKREMSLMSEQLQNLQELLTISNDSAQEENSKLAEAIMNVQTLNQQLSTQLTAAEQKVLLENQMNQLHEVKICELERLVSEKEVDLTRHDQAILDIRQTLQDSLKQNEDLHATIQSLNETILKMQNAVRKYETDNSMSRESNENCQLQINSCKDKLAELKKALEKKTSELCKLEMEYNKQNRNLKSAQTELKEMKERQKSKQCHMKCIIEELKEKLLQCEQKNKGALEEVKQLQTQLEVVTRKDAVKDAEIKRYRKIIGDLKKTLVELNKNLSKKNVQFESKCNNEECKKLMQNSELGNEQESNLNCPCEIEYYNSIVETLKNSVIDLKKKLTETQKKNEELEEDRKSKETKIADISKSQMEYNTLKEKLIEKLKQVQTEETRFTEMANQFEKELGSLRQELEVKTIQLDECKKSTQEIHSCRCVQLAYAEEEANSLKEEINGLLRKHCALNVEKEKLHSQCARMQSTVTGLEETSQLLKGQVEQYLLELQMVQNEKETLAEKNRDLLNELRSLQASFHNAGKQQRYNSEAVKILEMEMNELKNNRDEICFESKNVINYFRNWLQEQRKINQYVIAKERDFCETIEILKQENEELRFQLNPETPRPRCVRNISCIRSATPPPTCQSPWSLGSQGTASVHGESPSRSPYLNEECDWFSESFRNDSEDEEEDWVTKVEDLAAQVRRTNRMWKNKMGNSDYLVTKDTKK